MGIGVAVIAASSVQAKWIIANERFTQIQCLLFDYSISCDTGYSFYFKVVYINGKYTYISVII